MADKIDTLVLTQAGLARHFLCLALFAALCIAVAPAASAAACDSPLTIRSGDTLGEVAQRCGTSVSALLVNNPQVDESGAVKVGERIHLPSNVESYSNAALDKLLAPIALHPDVLLSEILPASTYPLEIVQAARWKEKNPRKEVGDDESWSDSVKALTRYPSVLLQMSDDIEWTQQLGEAFLAQPEGVVDSVQRLRQRADAAGNLKDNSVQDIVRERSSRDNDSIIRIVHSDPYYVHVPSYDSHYAYSSGHNRSGLHFGAGLLLGGWLNNTLDWHFGHLFYQPYHASAYQRFYRYNNYRPYTAYARNGVNYGRSPYLGMRWRHQPRHFGNSRGFGGLRSFGNSRSFGNTYDRRLGNRSSGYAYGNQGRRLSSTERANRRYNEQYRQRYGRDSGNGYSNRRYDNRRNNRAGIATGVRTRQLITPSNHGVGRPVDRNRDRGDRNQNRNDGNSGNSDRNNRRDKPNYNTRAWKGQAGSQRSSRQIRSDLAETPQSGRRSVNVQRRSNKTYQAAQRAQRSSSISARNGVQQRSQTIRSSGNRSQGASRSGRSQSRSYQRRL